MKQCLNREPDVIQEMLLLKSQHFKKDTRDVSQLRQLFCRLREKKYCCNWRFVFTGVLRKVKANQLRESSQFPVRWTYITSSLSFLQEKKKDQLYWCQITLRMDQARSCRDLAGFKVCRLTSHIQCPPYFSIALFSSCGHWQQRLT